MKRNRQMHLKGFTLMEIMIVIVFGFILFRLTTVFGMSSLALQEMDRTTQVARSELSLSRSRALSGKGGASWGVRFEDNAIVQFQGNSYNTRNNIYDVSSPLSNSVKVSGTREFVFTAPLGEPLQSGTVGFSIGSRVRNVSVNEYGMIEMQ
jgi:Tfp pilus assembly protein FimT